MKPYLNPFAPGAGMPPPELAGRDSMLIEAKNAIKRNTTGSMNAPKERLLKRFSIIRYARTIAQLKKFRDSYILVTGINRACIDLTTNPVTCSRNPARRTMFPAIEAFPVGFQNVKK